MDFTRTAKAALAATVIGAVMLGMSAFSSAADDSIRAREAALIIAAGAAQSPPTPQVTAEVTVNATDNQTEDIGFRYYPAVDLDADMQEFIFAEAEQAGVNYELVLAIIIHESRCNPKAISRTKDYGLMQINVCNHEWLAEECGLTDMLDPQQNIIAGITILARLSRFDDGTDAGFHKVLMAYNMGQAGASQSWEAGTYSTKYSRAVMKIREALVRGEYTKGE